MAKLISKKVDFGNMKKENEEIYVTRTFLPPIEEYEAYIRDIWNNDKLTNQGPILKKFETRLREYLGVENIHFVTNGTLALQVAIRALDIEGGEIITTPFSYVATTSAILWERCQPIFVDIDAETFCIDVGKIEKSITKDTRAILAVHVFGHPCDVERIEVIAKKYNLKVIYDGAHAFGVKYKGKALLDYGDVSICSFHATKLFHTIEGGCMIFKDDFASEKAELIKRFGHHGEDHLMPGINAKASEFQAAMGLCNFRYVEEIIEKRRGLSELYDKLLSDNFKKMNISDELEYNYAYYPILCKNESETLKVMELLNKDSIFPRRYFYPSLNKLPYIENYQACQIAEDVSSRILCLPLYVGLKKENVSKICDIMNKISVK